MKRRSGENEVALLVMQTEVGEEKRSVKDMLVDGNRGRDEIR